MTAASATTAEMWRCFRQNRRCWGQGLGEAHWWWRRRQRRGWHGVVAGGLGGDLGGVAGGVALCRTRDA
eukprot:1003755-Prymnesium_polylepis.1